MAMSRTQRASDDIDFCLYWQQMGSKDLFHIFEPRLVGQDQKASWDSSAHLTCNFYIYFLKIFMIATF